MNLTDARPGMRVRYIPGHAHGDRGHPDCEDGVVSSVNERFVFVRFHIMQEHGAACHAEDLVQIL